MLPNLIVIGAMRGGTTSLHNYLDAHPQISMSQPKELDFFILEKNWPKGLEWYEAHFDDKAKIRGESSPNYTKCHLFDGVPQRMHSVLPEAKLIYILRDPIERIISHYVLQVTRARERRSLAKLLMKKDSNYVLCSKYYAQLARYLEYYAKSDILVITSEDLYTNRQQTLQEVFGFLGVDETFYSEDLSTIHHKSTEKQVRTRIGRLLARIPAKRVITTILPFTSRLAKSAHAYAVSKRGTVNRPVLTEHQRQDLTDELKEDIDRLRECVGKGFEHWSV